jgi:hypothetical protein
MQTPMRTIELNCKESSRTVSVPAGVSTYDQEGVGDQERVHSHVACHVQTRLQRGHAVVRREHENERDGDDEQILVDLPEREDRLGVNDSRRLNRSLRSTSLNRIDWSHCSARR